jgi:hypothetical protein
MPFIPQGSPIVARVSFNAGVLTFGNGQAVMLDNITITMDKSTAPLFVLASIIAQDLCVHSLKPSLSAKIKSFAPDFDALAYGASVPGSPNEITVLDGQPSFSSPVLTATDRNGKQIQWQFINAVFKSSKATLKAEDYAEFDFELESTNIIEWYTS